MWRNERSLQNEKPSSTKYDLKAKYDINKYKLDVELFCLNKPHTTVWKFTLFKLVFYSNKLYIKLSYTFELKNSISSLKNLYYKKILIILRYFRIKSAYRKFYFYKQTWESLFCYILMTNFVMKIYSFNILMRCFTSIWHFFSMMFLYFLIKFYRIFLWVPTKSF